LNFYKESINSSGPFLGKQDGRFGMLQSLR